MRCPISTTLPMSRCPFSNGFPMKHLTMCAMIAVLVGCAHGYPFDGAVDDGSGGSAPAEEAPSYPKVSGIIPIKDPKVLGPYEETDDEALIYSIDQSFWLAFVDFVHYTYDPIDVETPCFNSDGKLRLVGMLEDNTSTDTLPLHFHVRFDNCLIPDAYIQANLYYTGTVWVDGYLDGSPFENMLTFSGHDMYMRGAIRYTDQHISYIDERCSFSFMDNFHESYNIGGLDGKICGQHVAIAERDLWQDD